jgi:pyrimidine operon attenuation protein/uracil phosphoribosyltransferase
VVVVDDVLNSGATLLYALSYFLTASMGRITTVVLVDRNHKRFPVKADIKGISLSTGLHERVEVDWSSPCATYLV